MFLAGTSGKVYDEFLQIINNFGFGVLLKSEKYYLKIKWHTLSISVQKRTKHKSLRQYSKQLVFYTNAIIHCESPEDVVSLVIHKFYGSTSDPLEVTTKTVE